MPKREVTSAPWVPVPARAYTGKAPRARQHYASTGRSAGSAQARPGCTRAAAGVGRRVRGARAYRGARAAGSEGSGGRGHLSERPGWPSDAPISRGSTASPHDRFRGPPRASPVRFQVSRPADRTSRGWARGVPLAGCRFPGPAARDGSGLRALKRALHFKRPREDLWWWWWCAHSLRITSGRLPTESGEVWVLCQRFCGGSQGLGWGWDSGAARERSSALAARCQRRLALRARAEARRRWRGRCAPRRAAGARGSRVTVPRATPTRSAPKAAGGAARPGAYMCSPRNRTAHVVSWGEWGCRRRRVLRAARD